MKFALALALAVAMVAGQAEASMQWRWTCKGEGIDAAGAFTTGDTPDADGYYAITGVTGEANGVAITGLQPARTAIPGNEGWPVDNLVRSKPPQLSPGGFGFALADGSYANPFYGARFEPPGFLAVIANPRQGPMARAQGRLQRGPCALAQTARTFVAAIADRGDAVRTASTRAARCRAGENS